MLSKVRRGMIILTMRLYQNFNWMLVRMWAIIS